MKQIKIMALIAATIMIFAVSWGKGMEAGEIGAVSVNTLRQPTEPTEFYV